MPQITKPSIPLANANNIVEVVNAIRTFLIATTNQDAGRADLTGSLHTVTSPTPSQFTFVKAVYNSVTFTASNGATVAIPVLAQLQMKNNVTGETWTFTAPGASTSGGVVGTSL